MLAKTREEKFTGYSGSLRTYSVRQVPDTSSGPEGGMSAMFDGGRHRSLKDFDVETLFVRTGAHREIAAVRTHFCQTDGNRQTCHFMFFKCRISCSGDVSL